MVRVVRGGVGRLLALLTIVLGIVYPCVAGLDGERQSLYFNLCALFFLASAASLLMKPWGQQPSLVEKPVAVA
jgi:hypothetical protein